jgi:hypothetical protein
LAENGKLSDANYTFFWQGLPSDGPRQHFAIRNSLLTHTTLAASGTERILALKLSTVTGPVHILSLYAPTLCSEDETKYSFYEDLDLTISNIKYILR